MKRMARIDCISCTMTQGSMVCFNCREKINDYLRRGISPRRIVQRMLPERQTTLSEFG